MDSYLQTATLLENPYSDRFREYFWEGHHYVCVVFLYSSLFSQGWRQHQVIPVLQHCAQAEDSLKNRSENKHRKEMQERAELLSTEL